MIPFHGGENLPGRLLGAGEGDLVEVVSRLLLTAGELHDTGVHAGVAGDVRLDAAGVDGGAGHAGPPDLELHAQGVGEAADGELGGVVGRLRGDADQPEHAGQVDDVAFTRGLQVREERLGAVDDAPEVDVHQPLEVLVGHGLDGGRHGHAGVVEDQVDLAVVLDHRIVAQA